MEPMDSSLNGNLYILSVPTHIHGYKVMLGPPLISRDAVMMIELRKRLSTVNGH